MLVGVHVCTIKLGFPLVDYFCSLPLSEFGEVAMTEERAEAATMAVKGNQRKKAEAAKMMKAMRDKDVTAPR